MGGEKKAGESRQLAGSRSGDWVLQAGRAARHVHAVQFQIIQGTMKVLMVFECAGAERTIHLDQVALYPVDAYMGHAVGHWEGDTLVTDVSSFTSETWPDRSGDFHSDALHVVERYTPITRDAFRYEATIEDKNVFTRPSSSASRTHPKSAGTGCCC
jgi:hypothetical protein